MSTQFIQPSSSLKQKVGDSSTEEDQLATAALSDALQRLVPELTDHIAADIAILQRIKTPFDMDKLANIYDRAHAVRGLAGSVSKSELGELTDSLCRYIKAVTDPTCIDHQLITAHLDAIALIAHNSEMAGAASIPLITALRNATAKNLKYTKQ
ncbi:MAG: hypothetical protein COA47_15100 [Robiginitomaculum sp.]|nr:MAG: hypothetical protein COA47_15100 [Robiginitomaculum sp.]